MHSVQVNVNLSLNVVTKTADGTQLMAFPLLSLTPVIFALGRLPQLITSVRLEAVTLANDIVEAAIFTGKVFAIGVHSLAFGLGVMT
jgi:hypothetical protein